MRTKGRKERHGEANSPLFAMVRKRPINRTKCFFAIEKALPANRYSNCPKIRSLCFAKYIQGPTSKTLSRSFFETKCTAELPHHGKIKIQLKCFTSPGGLSGSLQLFTYSLFTGSSDSAEWQGN